MEQVIAGVTECRDLRTKVLDADLVGEADEGSEGAWPGEEDAVLEGV